MSFFGARRLLSFFWLSPKITKITSVLLVFLPGGEKAKKPPQVGHVLSDPDPELDLHLSDQCGGLAIRKGVYLTKLEAAKNMFQTKIRLLHIVL